MLSDRQHAERRHDRQRQRDRQSSAGRCGAESRRHVSKASPAELSALASAPRRRPARLRHHFMRLPMRAFALTLASVFAVGLLSSPARLQEKGGEDETGPYSVVENWPTPWAPPGLHLGIAAGHLRRHAEPDLHRRARRAEAARHAAARVQRHLGIAQPARHRAQARDAQLHRRRRRQRQADRVVDAVGQAVRGRRRTAQDPHQPVRSASATSGWSTTRATRSTSSPTTASSSCGRSARRTSPAPTTSTSAGRRTSRGCPTAACSSPTAWATRASRSSTRTARS